MTQRYRDPDVPRNGHLPDGPISDTIYLVPECIRPEDLESGKAGVKKVSFHDIAAENGLDPQRIASRMAEDIRFGRIGKIDLDFTPEAALLFLQMHTISYTEVGGSKPPIYETILSFLRGETPYSEAREKMAGFGYPANLL